MMVGVCVFTHIHRKSRAFFFFLCGKQNDGLGMGVCVCIYIYTYTYTHTQRSIYICMYIERSLSPALGNYSQCFILAR